MSGAVGIIIGIAGPMIVFGLTISLKLNHIIELLEQQRPSIEGE